MTADRSDTFSTVANKTKVRHALKTPCFICGGYESMGRGQGKRCSGFTTADGMVCFCSREELAGSIGEDGGGLYAHKLHGPCGCGIEHGPELDDPKIEATYSYQNASGVEVFQVVRKVGKRFLQRRPLVGGAWEWKTAGMQMVPFRLPRLIHADPGRTVYICEGEKDVLTAERLGLLATCNPRGAGKWAPVAEIAGRVLAGRDVVVIPDNDEPGRKHAEQVAASLTTSKVVKVVPLPSNGTPVKDLSDFVSAGGTLEQLEAIVAAAPGWVRPEAAAATESTAVTAKTPQKKPTADTVRKPGELPRVERGKDVHRVLEDLDRALSDPETGDRRFYQRSGAGELVIARGVMAEDAARLRVKFAPGTIVLSPLRVASLLPRVTEHVDFGFWGFEEKTAEDGSTTKVRAWKTELPPGWLLSALLSKPFWAYTRPIRGVSVTPIIHMDGAIVADGYDPATQYLVASNIPLPSIPEHPTAEDAKAALAALREPFAEFPFETEDEKCSPVALALTLILRPVIRGNVPAFVFIAPQKNCGKSLTAKGACALAKGQIPAANTWPKLEEEQEKMIGAAADAGADVLFFDNVAEGAVIGGAPLDKVLTCDGCNSFRVLGLTQLKTLPWGATVIYTGNRARVGGDTDRRAAVSTLIRPDTSPGSYTHADLLGYIQSERPRLLAAAFTLIRAWVQAGSPAAGVRRLDSFEHWAATVAGMIKWAGGGDVRELVRDVVGTDTDEEEFVLLRGIHVWQTAGGRCDFTVNELVADVFASPLLTPAYGELRTTIEALAAVGHGETRKVDLRRLGKCLARMRDVLQGGYRLKQSGTGHGGLVRWQIVKVGGLGGLGGLISTPRAREKKTTTE